MNKIEASISLFIITFFASIQYIFLDGIPQNLSHFAFLCVTNFIGFLMTLAFFFGELFRLDLKQVKQSIILSGELIFFNIFMLIGIRGIEPAVTSAVLSSYCLLVLIFESIIYRRSPNKMSLVSVALIILGLFLMTDANIYGLYDINILYLIVADVFFAGYVMTVGSYATSSNPSILAMGQMFFCFIFSFILWGFESFFFGISLRLPDNKEFWVSVIYISFFIRGLYGIIQIYAQRYISPLNTSLIFSSEIVMTLLVSPLLAGIFGTELENITFLKSIGSCMVILGLMIIDPSFLIALKTKIQMPHLTKRIDHKIDIQTKIFLIAISAFVYLLLDIPIRMTEILPFYAAIKNALPFILGLFFGLYGLLGICVGCVISSLFMGVSFYEILNECRCIIMAGGVMFYGWHYFSSSHRIHFKNVRHYIRYLLLSIVASILCFDFDYTLSYFICGIIIGLPANILFGSLLFVEPIMPVWCAYNYDTSFIIDDGGKNLENINEILQNTAEEKGIKLKRVFEIQSCIEELSIRIFNAIPDVKLHVRLIYSQAVSVRINYNGRKYNPFKVVRGESDIDIMSLKIIKHRALRASFMYYKGENKIHVVM